MIDALHILNGEILFLISNTWGNTSVDNVLLSLEIMLEKKSSICR